MFYVITNYAWLKIKYHILKMHNEDDIEEEILLVLLDQ